MASVVSPSANASATPTVVEDRSESGSINEEFEHDRFPGPEEQKKHPYLVEFDPDDPLNPQVWYLIFNQTYLIFF